MKKRDSLFPTSFALLKDDLDVVLKLFISGGGAAAFLLLIYFHSIGFPEVFLPAIGSPQVLLAFFSGGAIVAVYFVIVFLLPVPMIDPRNGEIADVYKKLGISELQKALALLAFPATMSLSYLTQELWPILAFLMVVQLAIVSWGVREDINEFRIAGQWFLVASYWWFVALFMSLPVLVILKLTGEWSERFQWLSLLLYVVVLVGVLFFVKRVGWKIFSIFVAIFILVALLGANKIFVAGAARLLGARHDEPRWYWVDAKVAPTLPKGMDSQILAEDKGYYVKAVTPFSTTDIHILCVEKVDVNRDNSRDTCILTFDKADAKAVTTPKDFIHSKAEEADKPILPLDKSNARTDVTDLKRHP